MKVVILPGGQWQEEIVNYMKHKGCEVYVVNPYETYTTILANHFLCFDVVRDVEKISKALEEIKPDIITSDQSDIATLPVALLCERYNLRGNSVESVRKFTHKSEIFKHAKQLGIKTPETVIVNSVNDIRMFIKDNGLPSIIKPNDANASCGYFYIENEIDDDTFQYSKSQSFSDTVVVQNYVDGRQLTVDGILSCGKHVSLAIGERHYFREGIISEARYPVLLPEEIRNKIINLNNKYVENSGATFGITHAEYILNKDDVYLLEIGLRGGGNGTSTVVTPWLSGINLYDILYDNLLGHATDLSGINIENNKASSIKFFEFGKGKVKKISGDVSDIKELKLFKLWIKEGETINLASDGKTRHGVAIVCGNTLEQVAKAISKIETTLKVEFE